MELGGLASTASAARTDGRDAAYEGFDCLTVGRLALKIPTDRGRPVCSVIKWIFDPNLLLSTGFGPVRFPFSGPACSRSRSRSGTSPGRRGRRARRGPGGGAWPTPWPSSTRRSVGGLSPPTARTMPLAAAARYNPRWQRRRSRPVLHGHHADAGHRPEAAMAPPAPPVGTAPTTHPAPAAQQSPPRPTAYPTVTDQSEGD